MGYGCIKIDGKYEWEVYNTAYGLTYGFSPTLEKAIVEMVIAENDLFEHPLSDFIVKEMRKHPKKYAKDYPNPMKRR